MRILDISKVQAGHYELNALDEDIGPILESCISAIRQQAADKQIVLNLTVAPNLPKVHLDVTTVQSIIHELLANAIDFTEPNGTIEVEADREESNVVIRVEDAGTGICEDDIDRIMLPFEKGKNARSGDYARGGLGLPLALELTKLQGGRLTLSSVEGEGTTIRLIFPAAASAAAGRHRPQTS